MRKNDELLYWHKFRQYIHEDKDEKGDYCHYDPELPLRARLSFENWLRENTSRRDFKHLLRYIYPGGEQPKVTFERALKIARVYKSDIDYCKEFETVFVFGTYGSNFKYDSIGVLKDTGRTVNLQYLIHRGVKKGDHIAIYEILKEDEKD